MAKRRYKIVGIKEPGRVDIYPFGVINLHEQSDAMLEEILTKTGCPFIKPVVDAPDIAIKSTADLKKYTRSPKNK
jgi:hypothetical protein